jgi:hypothetical protein
MVMAEGSVYLCNNSSPPIALSAWTPCNKIALVKMVSYLKKTANQTKPSRWIITEVVVIAIVAELVLQ